MTLIFQYLVLRIGNFTATTENDASTDVDNVTDSTIATTDRTSPTAENVSLATSSILGANLILFLINTKFLDVALPK